MLILTNPSPLITAPTYTYLFNDQFTTDQAAPLGTSRTAQPGPGTWTIVDTNSKFAISGSRLSLIGGYANGDRYVSSLFARQCGRALLWEHMTHATQNAVWRSGWFTSNTTSSTPELGIQLATSNTTVQLRNQGITMDSAAVIGTSEHCFAMVMRSTGGWILTRNGLTGNYRLDYVIDTGTAGLYAKGVASGVNALNLTADNYRVTDLGGSWSTDWGIATVNKTLTPAAGSTYTANGDSIVEFSLDFDGLSTYDVWVHYTDDNNGYICRVTPDGTFSFIQVKAGVSTNFGTYTSQLGSGLTYRFLVVTDGVNHIVYINNGKVHTSSGNFGSGVGGVKVGTGNISYIGAWPRYIDLQGA